MKNEGCICDATTVEYRPCPQCSGETSSRAHAVAWLVILPLLLPALAVLALLVYALFNGGVL